MGTSGWEEARDLPRPRNYNLLGGWGSGAEQEIPRAFSPDSTASVSLHFLSFKKKKIFFNLFFWLTPGLNVASKIFIFIAACKLLAAACTI